MIDEYKLNIFKKILNTYGKRKLRPLGLDLVFEVSLDRDRLQILVFPNGTIPTVVKNLDEWNDQRYEMPKLVINNLLYEVGELVELPRGRIILNVNDSPVLMRDVYGNMNLSKDISDWERTSLNKTSTQSPLFVYLSNDDVISKRSAISYPLHSDNTIEGDDGFHLVDIENQDWWDSLTDIDKQKITYNFG